MYDKGRKLHTPLFTIFFLPNESDAVRIGITVTRKVGNSVARNRCRRLVREAFRLNQARFADLRVDVVVNAKRELVTARYDLVEAELLKVLSRITR